MIHHRLHGLRVPVPIVLVISIVCVVSRMTAHPCPLPASGEDASQAQQQPAPAPSTTPQQQQPAPQQQQPATPPQQPATPQQPPAQRPTNPFENVPAAPEKPAQPAPTPQEGKAALAPNIIEEVQFRGQHKVPQDTLRAMIYTKKGDVYDEESIHRDFIALWNSGRFDDLRIEKDQGPNGGIVLRFVVTERRTVHTIDYTGNKSISKSEILDRFKERKVNLTPESQYDPGRVQRAKNVLLEYEAERGHQYATVTPQIRQVPPGGVDITFAIDEGPKVKVGHIIIDGNSVFSSRDVIRAMKNLKPIGIPHSLLFENLFARTYDSTKLEEDSERIRQFYQSRGYFEARVISHHEQVYDVYGRGVKIPLINPKHSGKRVDITMVVSEGNLFHLRNFRFVGMKLFRTPDLIERQVFHMTPGAVFSTERLQKGLDDMRKLYGNFGYIDFVPSPDPEVAGTNQIDLTIDVDEGHQFFIRRIDFQGNTTTRDRVIRREILVDEGDLYSQQLLDTSILRLNQLGYFDPLKAEDAWQITRDTKTNTVDLLLKVHERGKNSIQLNGGVSAISGSFIGFSYSTNNFLGLGETLSLSSQIGTLLDNVTFGFTEPYVFDKPIQAGFTVFYSRYRFNQAQQESVLAGTNLISYYTALGSIGCPSTQPTGCNLLNYTTDGRGFTTFVSHALRRSFARFGLTYGYTIQTVHTQSLAAQNYFEYIDFDGITGPNSLNGIRSSTLTPTFAYNSVDHPIIPHRGLRVTLTFGFTGSVLGGNVDMVQPGVDVAYFRRGIWKSNVMGFHFNGRVVTGFDGKVVPPFNRYYIGGENDVRGFDLLTISPIAYIPTEATVNVLNNDGTPRVQKIVNADGSIGTTNVVQTIPAYQLLVPGGDTVGVFNYEYRIPIVGPVALAPFVDAGVNRLSFPGQLGLSEERVQQLDAIFPQADFNPRAVIAPGTEKPRVSVGLELQVLMPVVNAPFRLYWAYNLSYVNVNLQPPIVVDRSFFPNNATYQSAIDQVGLPVPGGLDERRSIFRFSIGRTF